MYDFNKQFLKYIKLWVLFSDNEDFHENYYYFLIDVWSIIASPFLPKYLSSPCCASLHGVIYLIGDNTKKVYVYDPDANIWQKVGKSGVTILFYI